MADSTKAGHPPPRALIAIYAGSFDPLTLGHLDIVARAARLFARLVIGVGVNATKSPLLSLQDRLDLATEDTAPIAQQTGTPIAVHPFAGLAVDFAQTHGATVMVRGLRTGTDLDYEQPMAAMNRSLAPGIETVFLVADPALQPISSTLVRQIAHAQGNIAPFLPPATLTRLRTRLQP